jgi:hypothetical protein
MPLRHHARATASFLFGALTLAASLTLASAVGAQPAVGFREEWSGGAGNTDGWGGGSNYANPGTGGVGGDGDGYLVISTALPGRLGGFASNLEYIGDWQVAGITQIRLWLNDVNGDDPIELHVSVGNGANLWQYNVGFNPPNGKWAEFVVDLTNPANFSHIVGLGTFTGALQDADRILIRHDLAPFVQTPDLVQGDVGVDHLLLTNGTVGVDRGGAAIARALVMSAPSPNPSRGEVRFSIETFEAGPIALDVLDIAGRRVRRAVVDAGGPGLRTWVWDGRDDAGRLTAPGAYRVRASGRSGGVTRAVVRVR